MPSTKSQLDMAEREASFTQDKSVIGRETPKLAVLNSAELSELEPKIRVTEFGAIWSPFCSTICVSALTRALISGCQDFGVTIREHSEVKKILSENGTVLGVEQMAEEGQRHDGPRRPCDSTFETRALDEEARRSGSQ